MSRSLPRTSFRSAGRLDQPPEYCENEKRGLPRHDSRRTCSNAFPIEPRFSYATTMDQSSPPRGGYMSWQLDAAAFLVLNNGLEIVADGPALAAEAIAEKPFPLRDAMGSVGSNGPAAGKLGCRDQIPITGIGFPIPSGANCPLSRSHAGRLPSPPIHRHDPPRASNPHWVPRASSVLALEQGPHCQWS